MSVEGIDGSWRDPRLGAIALFLAAATLAKAPFVAGATVGDLAFLGACVLSARWVTTNSRVARSRWNGIAVVLVIWAMVSAVLAPLVSSLEFSDVELAKSLLRLSVLVTGAILLATLVEGASRQWIGRVILFAMTVNAIAALGLYVAAWLWPGFLTGVEWIDRYFIESPLGGGAAFRVVRAQGIFAEPSFLGLFQTLGIGYLAFVSNDLLKRFDWRKALVILSIVLTLSLGAYAMLLAIGIGLVIRQSRRGQAASVSRISIMALMVALAVSMLVLMQLGTSEVLLDRLSRVIAAQDLSAMGRLVGSWDVALDVAYRSPVVGSGLGNLTIAAEGFGYTFEAAGRTLDAVPSWNIFAIALGSIGVVGLVLYSLLVFDVVSRNAAAGVTIGLAGFVTGGLLVATTWVFFGLYAATYQAAGPARPDDGDQRAARKSDSDSYEPDPAEGSNEQPSSEKITAANRAPLFSQLNSRAR